MPSPESKLALPAFLKMLTADKLPMPKAMVIASKVYKSYSTPAALAGLTDAKLKNLGVEDKEERKSVLAAIRKAGYTQRENKNAVAGPSKMKASGARKRRREEVLEDLLPEGPKDESLAFGSFDFEEQMDEKVLRTKLVVINRAPAMTAWAAVVAERLGFKREEALSIASAYTEMNAVSKGVSIGIFDKQRADGIELAKGGSQPYVDFMGRRALYTSQPSGQWRALIKGEPVSPGAAFRYLTSSFRQTLPFVMGALRLLAESFSPGWLGEHGFALYKDFRPGAAQWGERAEMRCATILALRKKGDHGGAGRVDEGKDGDERAESKDVVEEEGSQRYADLEDESERPAKRVKSISVEEYEATLNDADTYGAFWDEDV